MKKRAQGFNTAAQDSNPCPLSKESEVLPMSHCALRHYMTYIPVRQTPRSLCLPYHQCWGRDTQRPRHVYDNGSHERAAL